MGWRGVGGMGGGGVTMESWEHRQQYWLWKYKWLVVGLQQNLQVLVITDCCLRNRADTGGCNSICRSSSSQTVVWETELIQEVATASAGPRHHRLLFEKQSWYRRLQQHLQVLVITDCCLRNRADKGGCNSICRSSSSQTVVWETELIKEVATASG